MDYQNLKYLDRDDQLSGDTNDAHRVQMEGRIRNLHTMLPGIVVSFDADKQTAQVQPAIKRIFTTGADDEAPIGPVNLPPCVDCPVVFPGGGDFVLTFPVKAGDECILLFSERAIDYWYAYGGIQLPAEYRLHDLSDAIVIVGLNSQPRKLANLCMSGTELRSRDGQSYLRMENGQITIKGNVLIEGNATVSDQLTAQNGVQITGSLQATGEITAEGTSVHSHTHGGVQPGSGNTGVPN